MFDRVDHPARGREGGQPGGATRFELDDGTVMRGKGRQAIPPGRRVILALPGGAGYGAPKDRERDLVRRDLEHGYISREAAIREYGISPEDDE
jgi:N-methylhydantoinase B